MKKTITLTLLATLCSFCLQAQTGTQVSIKLTTGVNDLLPKSSVFFKVNYMDGTSSEEYNIYVYGGLPNGFLPRSSHDFTVELPRPVELSNIRSFTIRHVSALGNGTEPYDNWDLSGVKISLVNRIGIRTWSFLMYNSAKSFLTRFNASNRSLTVDRPLGR